MNPLEIIQYNYSSFTKTEQTIAAYILNNPKEFARSTIEASVDAIGTSKAAMIRFAKKIGYNGYTEFKYELSRFLVSTSFTNPEDQIEPTMTIQVITQHYCQFIDKINQTVHLDEIHKMAQSMLNARRIKLFAINRTALGAQQLKMRMLKIGFDADTCTDNIMMMDLVNTLDERDYALIFTVKDNGKIYNDKVNTLVEHGCTVDLVTMSPNLPFAKKCRQVITLPSVSMGYAKFIDEQAIYFVFVEILLAELARLANQHHSS